MLDVNALSPHENSTQNLDNNMDTDSSNNINNSVQNLLKNATGFQNESQNSAATAVAAAAFNSFMNAAHLNSALFASTSNVLGGNNTNLGASPISNASCNGVFNNNLLKSNQSSVNRDENGGKKINTKISFLVKLEMSTTPSINNNNNGSTNTSRSRLMFDPLSELPILERWFEENPHPGWLQIEQFTGKYFLFKA